jgi:hypothetical protein
LKPKTAVVVTDTPRIMLLKIPKKKRTGLTPNRTLTPQDFTIPELLEKLLIAEIGNAFVFLGYIFHFIVCKKRQLVADSSSNSATIC